MSYTNADGSTGTFTPTSDPVYGNNAPTPTGYDLPYTNADGSTGLFTLANDPHDSNAFPVYGSGAVLASSTSDNPTNPFDPTDTMSYADDGGDNVFAGSGSNASGTNPFGGSLFNNTTSTATATVTVADQRVRLTPKNLTGVLGAQGSGALSVLYSTNGFMFPYTPTVVVAGAANYETQSVTHANQDYRIYTSTPSQTFEISGEFTASTTAEAQYMAACIHFLRTVTKMRFGQGTNLGLPPPMMILNGYGTFMFNNLPVIITNYTVQMPNNVDYVATSVAGCSVYVPAVTTITVTCVVQNTPNTLRTFNWDNFASGALIKSGGWF